MKEFGALFVTGYLVSSFFLIPLMGLYLGLSLKKVYLGPILQLHKILILLSIILPVGMFLISCSGDLKMDFWKGGESNQARILSEPAAIEYYDSVASDSPSADPAANRLPTIQDVIFYFVDLIIPFSILGLLIFVLRYGLQAWRLSRIQRNSVVSTINTNCRLIESIRVRSPFSVGLFRKSIFMPDDIPPSEKEMVIQHELNHFQCHHHLWTLLEALLACIFWFNPIAHILRRHGVFLRELECDRQTIQKIDRFEYTRLLVKTAETIIGNGGNSQFSLMIQRWSRKGELKMRIENLMHKGSWKRKKAVSILIAVAVLVTVGFTLFHGNLNDTTKKELLARINLEYRQKAPLTARVEIEKVPPHFIIALLLQEDSRFYDHKGVSVKSVVRAIGANLKSFFSGKTLYKDGGSTITQQLAKQFINNPQRTLKRKFEELKIARVLEKYFTKDEILEMYLNIIYFGNEAFGLKAASDTYFGHDYTDLTLAESAMLVPFIKAPAKYNLLKDPATAKKRQEYLLERIATATRGS